MNNFGSNCIIAMVVFILCGCATTQRDWEAASQRNNIDAYQFFVNKHADSEYVGEARQRVQQLRFAQAQKAGTEKALEAYIVQYPLGSLSEQARKLLEQLAFKAANTANSVSGYEKFLLRFPNGLFSHEAEGNIRVLLFQTALKDRTVASYEQFLARYPQGDDSAELQKRLPDIRKWKQIKTLGDILIRMAPQAQMRMSVSGMMEDMKVGPIETYESPTRKQDMSELRSRLDAGDDPNMVRIAGFELPGTRAVPGFPGLVLSSLGKSGMPVPAAEGGMSLLEYCKANKLDDAYRELVSHGAE